MSSDVRDREVREFLFRMANEAPASASTPRAALRRAHRRLALTGFVGLVVVGLVAYGAFSGIRAIEASPTERPADQGGSPTTITVGSQPTALTVDEGAVWVANSGDGTVSRIDPATDQVVATIEVGGQDSNIDITSGDGAVWVTTADGVVQRIDPETNEVVASIDVSAPIHPAAGFEAVWVSDYDAGRVTRIDPATNEVAAIIPVPGSDPHGIAIVEDSVWVAIDDTGDGGRRSCRSARASAARSPRSRALHLAFAGVGAGLVFGASAYRPSRSTHPRGSPLTRRPAKHRGGPSGGLLVDRHAAGLDALLDATGDDPTRRAGA